MRSKRPLKLVLALLLTLILPLKGFASAHCEAPAAEHSAHFSHGGASSHCHDGGAGVHLHGCGDCCGVAAITVALSCIVPRLAPVDIPARATRPPPAVDLDRLDRPPRLPA